MNNFVVESTVYKNMKISLQISVKMCVSSTKCNFDKEKHINFGLFWSLKSILILKNCTSFHRTMKYINFLWIIMEESQFLQIEDNYDLTMTNNLKLQSIFIF